MRKKTATESRESFLKRWSAKKSGSDATAHQKALAAKRDEKVKVETCDLQPADDSALKTPVDDEPVLRDEDMPDIETLDEKSDLSGFFSPGVSGELRRLAFRKLFRSQIFNVRDGLDDYDEDFRGYAALGEIITSDMKHQAELAQEKLEESENADQAPETLAAQDQADSQEDDGAEQENRRVSDRQAAQAPVSNDDCHQENDDGSSQFSEKQGPESV